MAAPCREQSYLGKTLENAVKKTIVAFAVATVGLGGCMTYDPYTGEEKNL